MTTKTINLDNSDVYNIANYTDDELYSILNLSNPTDRELEITINNKIDTFSNNIDNNEEYTLLTKFFKDMSNHFFENTGIIDPTLKPDTTQPIPDNGIGSTINYTYPFQYTTGQINALKRQTTTRIISINSSDRDRDIYPVSTSFLCNLSENLQDVVNIKMSSVKIPHTWYTVMDGYGSNFFYIIGNVPGLTNGNYDWKISIIPGNYTEENIISSINDSLLSVFSTVADISFVSGSNSVSYNNINKKASFSLNFNQYYNESYYYINFPVFTNLYSGGDAEYNSIPSFLGLCKDTYSMNTIYSKNPNLLTKDEYSSVLYKLTETTALFTIFIYAGPEIFDGSTYLDKIDIKVSVTGNEESRESIIYRFNEALSSESKLTNSLFSIIDTSYSSIDFVETYGIMLNVKYNRYSADTINSSGLKTAVMFPEDSDSNIWIGGDSCFGFDASIIEINDIVSERGKVFNNYIVSSGPYILLKCIRDGYTEIENSGHDISLNITDGNYTLTELFNEIRASTEFKNITDTGINNTFNCKYNIPYITKGEVPYFGINIYREYDNSYFSFNTDVSNLLFGNSSFFKLTQPSTTTTTGINTLYVCDIDFQSGYGLGTFESIYTRSIIIKGDSNYFPNEFSVNVEFDMIGVSTITDIVSVINRTFVKDMYNSGNVYGVYLNGSTMTAGNKRANVVAIQGISSVCSLIYSTLRTIINNIYTSDVILYDIFNTVYIGFNNYGSLYFNNLYNLLIDIDGVDSSGNIIDIENAFKIGKNTLTEYITSLIVYMDTYKSSDSAVSIVYSSQAYSNLIILISKLKSVLLIYDGDTASLVDNNMSFENDNFKYNLNMNVKMSMTNDNYKVYLCDPKTSEIDTVDGGGIDICGNFTGNTTNFWYEYLKFNNLSYNLSALGGTDISYETIITSGDVVYENNYYLTNENNYFYIRASYDVNGGVYTTIANIYDSSINYYDIKVVIGLTIDKGYTSYEIVSAIQDFFDSNKYLTGSTITIDDVYTMKTTIRVCIDKSFNPMDYKIVFYDNTLFTTCKNTLTTSIKKITWDTTIGWMLGFRKLTEYPLGLENMYYDSESETTYYRTYYRSVFLYDAATGRLSISGDTTVSVNLYSYFMIILDDFNQNHLNDGLITITNRDTSTPLPAYTSKSYIQCNMATDGNKYIGDINSNGTMNKLTANQIYSANQKLVSNNNINSKFYSSGLYAKDMIALLPNITSEINQSDSYLKTQERSYFGPICLNRMKIQLINDRGTIVDLNGSEWSFVLTAEILYSEISV